MNGYGEWYGFIRDGEVITTKSKPNRKDVFGPYGTEEEALGEAMDALERERAWQDANYEDYL